MSPAQNNPKPGGPRDDLAGEHPLGDAGQIILACLFAGIWILDSFFLNYTTFPNSRVPVVIRTPVGVALLLVAGYLAYKAHAIVFKEIRETPGVIRKGVFSLVRHPLYLSEILLYLGLVVLSISLAGAGVLLLAILFLYAISRHEEKLLLGRFGAEYEEYRRDVPMFVPKPWKK